MKKNANDSWNILHYNHLLILLPPPQIKWWTTVSARMVIKNNINKGKNKQNYIIGLFINACDDICNEEQLITHIIIKQMIFRMKLIEPHSDST